LTSVGILDRFIRSSSDRALKMQPKRVAKVADEYLYAAPAVREEIEGVRNACRRLVEAGLASASLGRIAMKRTDHAVSQIVPGSDLTAVDARHFETADRSLDDPVVEAAAVAGAAVLAHPVSLLALAVAGRTPDTSITYLAEQAGPIEIVDALPSDRPGVWILPSLGAVAIAADVDDAVTRLEAAERLAAITVTNRER
jgi:ribulose-5-phosphate 4-epimerase/fuculose-1-phosphate aldolase